MTHHVILTPILIGISLKTENLTLKETLSRPVAHKQQRTVIVVTILLPPPFHLRITAWQYLQ